MSYFKKLALIGMVSIATLSTEVAYAGEAPVIGDDNSNGQVLVDNTHGQTAVSYTHLRAHETDSYLVCRLLLEKKKYAVFCLKKKNSFFFFFFLMIRRQPRSTHCISSAASDVYKRQV